MLQGLKLSHIIIGGFLFTLAVVTMAISVSFFFSPLCMIPGIMILVLCLALSALICGYLIWAMNKSMADGDSGSSIYVNIVEMMKKGLPLLPSFMVFLATHALTYLFIGLSMVVFTDRFDVAAETTMTAILFILLGLVIQLISAIAWSTFLLTGISYVRSRTLSGAFDPRLIWRMSFNAPFKSLISLALIVCCYVVVGIVSYAIISVPWLLLNSINNGSFSVLTGPIFLIMLLFTAFIAEELYFLFMAISAARAGSMFRPEPDTTPS